MLQLIDAIIYIYTVTSIQNPRRLGEPSKEEVSTMVLYGYIVQLQEHWYIKKIILLESILVAHLSIHCILMF